MVLAFPKSHDIGKAIDRESGAQRQVVGNNKNSWCDSKTRR
jgi:hypothetical protein